MELAAHWHRCQNLSKKTSEHFATIQGESCSCQHQQEQADAGHRLAPSLDAYSMRPGCSIQGLFPYEKMRSPGGKHLLAYYNISM